MEVETYVLAVSAGGCCGFVEQKGIFEYPIASLVKGWKTLGFDKKLGYVESVQEF